MATRVAAAGGGNWTAGATWVGGVAPTAADDAQLSGSSGAVTIDAGAVARSLDCTGYTGTLTHTAAVTLTLGDASAGLSNIALKLVAGMTYTLGSVTTSAITIASTTATQQTFSLGGKSCGNLTLAGSTTGNLAITSAITQDPTAQVLQSGGNVHYDGATDNAGLSHTVGTIGSSGSTAKTFTFGTATVTATRSGASAHFNIPNGINNTVSAASATLVGASAGTGRIVHSYLFPTDTVIGTLTLNSEGENEILTRCQIGTLNRNGNSAPHNQLNLPNASSITVTTAINIIGQTDARITVWPNTDAVPTTLICTGATLNFQHCDFQDIIFNRGGGNVDLSAATGGSGDCGGNVMTGGGALSFTPATTQTWNNSAGGNWSTAANWTSRVPLVQDTVVIPGPMTASPTIQADRKFMCRDLSVTTTDPFTLNLNQYEGWMTGAVSLASGCTLARSASNQWVLGPRSTVAFAANGAPTPSLSLRVNAGNGGRIVFGDAWTVNGLITTRSGIVEVGAASVLSLNGYASTASSTGLASSNLVLSGVLRLVAPSYNTATPINLTQGPTIQTVTDNGGRIEFTSLFGATRTIAGLGQSFPDIRIAPNGSGAVAITGANRLARLPVLTGAGTGTVILPSAVTTTIRSPGDELQGNGTSVLTIKSSTGASAATISKAQGRVRGDYLSLQDLTATGGAIFSAGANSTNVSGNTGWTFTAAVDCAPQALLAA